MEACSNGCHSGNPIIRNFIIGNLIIADPITGYLITGDRPQFLDRGVPSHRWDR